MRGVGASGLRRRGQDGESVGHVSGLRRRDQDEGRWGVGSGLRRRGQDEGWWGVGSGLRRRDQDDEIVNRSTRVAFRGDVFESCKDRLRNALSKLGK